MNPLEIIEKYFVRDSLSYDLLIEHGRHVAEKAISVAGQVEHLVPDIGLIDEAAMLHDIGIIFVNAPQIGCHGEYPYICHGYLGRELLEKEGFPIHALICERHIGAGITVRDIDSRSLPLPRREMQPLSLEEKIVCYADKFFSKNPGQRKIEKSIAEVRIEMRKYGKAQLKQFNDMHLFFSRRSFQERVPVQGQ